MATKAKRTTAKRTPSRHPQGPQGPTPPLPPEPPGPRRCLVPRCPRTEVRRGLCHPCAAEAGALVRSGQVTWATLEAVGKARPMDPEAPRGDLPHRRAWFLGQWAPGDPWPIPPIAAEAPAATAAEEAPSATTQGDPDA